LDERGLCKIISNVGEEYLCHICREHPRFYNYTSVAEVGIGMSCPEAARIILSSPDYSIFEKIGDVDADADSVEFDGRSTRDEVYCILRDASLPYAARLDKLYDIYSADLGDDSRWLEILDTLEYLDTAHKNLFLKYSSSRRPDGKDEYLERFLAYLIYRHCTEAYDAEDFCSRLTFCLFCEQLLASLICTEQAKSLQDVATLASIISEELEYSEDNTFALTY
jgi:lysine-N-methylase